MLYGYQGLPITEPHGLLIHILRIRLLIPPRFQGYGMRVKILNGMLTCWVIKSRISGVTFDRLHFKKP